jgi:uncharacterized protein
MRLARILWPVIATALGPMWPASAATPSFDCTQTESSAENLVCADEELAELDREVARLFVLARNGLRPNSLRLPELIGTQRGWIRERDDCWKEPDVRVCVFRSYAIRIHELREAYAGARRLAASGISKGPLTVDCTNFDSLISATFIQSDLPMVYLTWRNMYHLVLTLSRSASGARYVGKYDGDREVVFWEKGREALLELPGRTNFTCEIREPG